MTAELPIRPRLGVNVDHVATIRQARGVRYPDPVAAAAVAERAGADQITVHLREDRRHIQDRDVEILRRTVETRLNLEMGATDEMLKVALDVRPDIVTLVPEKREERTTEGGLQVAGNERLPHYLEKLRRCGAEISLFVDPDADQLEASADLGVDTVELHTGDFCRERREFDNADAFEKHSRRELARLVLASQKAANLGLRVAAGHGLDYKNVLPVAAIDEIEEFNIGHSIVARAVIVGFDEAVREMIRALEVGRSQFREER